jgi:hypothetical protein
MHTSQHITRAGVLILQLLPAGLAAPAAADVPAAAAAAALHAQPTP